MEESKQEVRTETFTDKIEKNKTVIKIVEYFYMKEILDEVKESPSRIFTLLDEELIRVADYFKNDETFNYNIVSNLLELLNKRSYSPLFVELILLSVLFHLTLNNDENFKIHTDLLIKLNKLKDIKGNDIVNILIKKVEENNRFFYPLNNLSEKED